MVTRRGLFVLPAMRRAGGGGQVDMYDIAVRQFTQQILPASLPATQVFGYGASGTSGFHCPAAPGRCRPRMPLACWR